VLFTETSETSGNLENAAKKTLFISRYPGFQVSRFPETWKPVKTNENPDTKMSSS
jgi:hypothetical protein